MLRAVLSVLTLLSVLSPTLAVPQNRTIDDQRGDAVTGFMPVYQPAKGWSFGPECPTCFINAQKHVDTADIFDGTWHDTTAGPGDVKNVTLSFTGAFSLSFVPKPPIHLRAGTAIYVFCMVPNFVQDTTTAVRLSFTLDGVQKGTFLHEPDLTNQAIAYNVPVLSLAGLANSPHTLVVSPTATSGGDLQDSSLMLFDYAIYTCARSLTCARFSDAFLPQSRRRTRSSQCPHEHPRPAVHAVLSSVAARPSRHLRRRAVRTAHPDRSDNLESARAHLLARSDARLGHCQR
jgi:hypothetical protein